MKIRFTVLTTFLLQMFSLHSMAIDYNDITSTYLTNTSFDSNFDYDAKQTGNVAKEILDIDGWTKNINVDYTITGIYQFGTSKTFNGASIPATGQDGTSNGGCLALSTGWNESLLYYQDVELPAGKYAIVYAVYNCSDKTAGVSKTGWLQTGKTAILSSINSFNSGTWIVDTVKFELTATAKGKIQLGYTAGSGGSANSAKIVIDYIKLLRDTPVGKIDVDVYKVNLNSLINEAKELYGTGSGNEAENLKTAIEKALNVYNDNETTIAQVEIAMDELNKAIDTYLWLNPTGSVPTVTTGKRFARGATMAFARLTVSGSDITERGICWSEHSEPTINDNRTTEYLSNNGNIYWLKNLKPATKYYMRAYAITKGRQIGYGDIIKFYTIPKGNVQYTIRQDGDNATIQRITNACRDAAYWWNNLTEIKHYNSSVGFVNGVPTADCSYGGWVRVGSNQSYQKTGTILHEWLHGVGVIPWADTEWSRHNLRSSVNGDGYGTGTWLGDRVTDIIRFLDNNETGTLNGDYQHMWPWGINGAHEDNGTDILYIGNSLVCQALGEDGLQHTSKEFAQPYYAFNHEDNIRYYIKNESSDYGLFSSYLTVDEIGNLVWKQMSTNDAISNDNAAWFISFTPNNQYYQIRNVATGKYITYTGSTTNGFRTADKTTITNNENLHLMKSRVNVTSGSTTINHRGYWIIHPTENWTPPCLTPLANGATSTEVFNIANNANSQRWLILTENEVKSFADVATEGIKSEIKNALAHLKLLYSVPHIEEADGVDAKTSAIIDKAEQMLNNSSSSDELQNVLKEINDGTYYFLCNATPSDIKQPFDLTSLLQNTGMDNNTGWNDSPSIQHSTGEFYQNTFDLYQSLSNVPAGTYQFRAQAFHRPGKSEDAYNAFVKGTNSVSAYIYAGNKSQKVLHIASQAQKSKIGKGNESAVGSPTVYMPNDRESARAYFDNGLYENAVTCSIDKDGSTLKVGIRSNNMSDYYWCCFDNFRLYFYGNTKNEDVTSINDISLNSNTQNNHAIYSIDGRLISKKLSDFNKLNPGIYIINGKKYVK